MQILGSHGSHRNVKTGLAFLGGKLVLKKCPIITLSSEHASNLLKLNTENGAKGAFFLLNKKLYLFQNRVFSCNA